MSIERDSKFISRHLALVTKTPKQSEGPVKHEHGPTGPFDSRMRCYSFSVRAPGNGYLISGWEPALTHVEAADIIRKKHGENCELVELRDSGSWLEFLNEGRERGWD